MSEEGIDRFADLCVKPNGYDDPPIHNPKQFPKFAQIYAKGTSEQLKRVEQGRSTIEGVYDTIKRNEKKLGVLRDLEDINKRIKKLELAKFTSSDRESEVITEINQSLSLMLWKIDRKEGKYSMDLLGELAVNLAKVRDTHIQNLGKAILKAFKKKA